MRYLRHIAITVGLSLCQSAPASVAAGVDSCQDLIKECFAGATARREACFQSIATSFTCTTGALGALVTQRIKLSPDKQPAAENGPAFLGPQMINRRCINNFDTAWSAALIKSELSPDSISSLAAALDECSSSETHQLPHP